jgi:ArsR family transcriptional regulator, arsenate/arsenite/antimonite-responsive transcriptional repressor / arsenate reductase (thioredoxin)
MRMAADARAIEPVAFLNLLAHDLRWQIVEALARSDYRVQELVERLDRPINLVSYHLARLRGMKLVRERRSDADSRDVYYTLDLDRLRAMYQRAGESIHPGLTLRDEGALSPVEGSESTPARVLFLCTENSARSQMAEGLLRHYGRGMVEAYSAGSHPSPVHPLAIRQMAEWGIDISHHRSKSMDELHDRRFDYVITVCDRVREACPAFPGDPERIHWSFADPAAVQGAEEERRVAFLRVATELQTMVRYLLILIEKGRRQAVRAGIGREAR